MIRAIVRPEMADKVTDGLSDSGFFSMTKMSVIGRGKQKGIKVGNVIYDELPKSLIIVVVEDNSVDEVLKIIQYKAYTGSEGDGKIFISPVDSSLTIRTGSTVL